jgi:sodium-dependent dicarboxylate transporter 2/3/5
MPYAVTSLLPLAFFPMAGILPGDEVCLDFFKVNNYYFLLYHFIYFSFYFFKDITTLFVGTMILAQAMEHVRLHRRLALLVLSFVGSSIKWYKLFFFFP